MELDRRLQRVLIDEAAIRLRMDDLAREIVAAYPPGEPLCVVGILKGACLFTADLIRALSRAGKRNIRLEFIRASAYQDGMKASGEVNRKVTITGLTGDLANMPVLLVDDILDQGFTLSAIKDFLQSECGVPDIKTCVFLEKTLLNPSEEVLSLRRRFQVDFRAFSVEDRWVVGYGMDVSEEFRELPYVAIAREERFR